jgi:hypothetical protein
MSGLATRRTVNASHPARPPCDKAYCPGRLCSHECRSCASGCGNWRHHHRRRCRPRDENSSTKPRLRSVVTRQLRAMGIRDKPTSLALAEWLGSIRRECLDHIIVLGEAHLRQILQSYARYYNVIRTQRSLDKDAPVARQIQRIRSTKSHAILGGLHHHYVRA